MAARACARGRELSGVEGPCDAFAVAHGVRECSLSERRRMLEPAHRHVHDSRERVYAPLRVLCCAKGRASRGGL